MAKPSIPGTDFVRLDEVKLQTCTLLLGGPGSGKTTFALRYAPEPVALINLDGRAEHTVKKEMRRGRDIHYMHIRAPKIAEGIRTKVNAKTIKLCEKAVGQFERNYTKVIEHSLKPKGVRTIAIDTGTEYNELLSYAYKGQLGPGKDFGQSKDLINQKWRVIYDLAKEEGNAHLIVLARCREKWVGNEPTGFFEHRGAAAMDELADWVGHLELKTKSKTRRGKKVREFDGFQMNVMKAGNNINEFAETYNDSDWGVEGLEAMVELAEANGNDEEYERLMSLAEACPDGPGPFVYSCMRQYPDVDYLEWV